MRLIKRLIITLVLTTIAIAKAMIPNAITYEATSNGSHFPWRNFLHDPMSIGFIVFALIYNIYVSVVNKKKEKYIDILVLLEVKSKNYEKLYNHHINKIIERNDPDEIRKELRQIEKGLV